MTERTPAVLSLRGVTKHYRVPRRGAFTLANDTIHAVDDVSIEIREDETVALVGESGSGKSTTAKIALGLVQPTSGAVFLADEDVGRLGSRAMRRRFRPAVQAVFQDPGASLNPRKSILQILRGPLLLHRICPRRDVPAAAATLLETVGLSPGEAFLHRYPYELSGGQQQRVGIARALAVRPRAVIADEPVSALDVSVRAQILRLLRDTQRTRHVGILIITHDLAVVRSIADRVAVMYLGQIIESGTTDRVFQAPRHPYTRALMQATPRPEPDRRTLLAIQATVHGEPPSAAHVPPGCRFHDRCPIAIDRCRVEVPAEQTAHGDGGVRCHRAFDDAVTWSGAVPSHPTSSGDPHAPSTADQRPTKGESDATRTA